MSGGGGCLNRQVGKGEKQLRGKGDFTPTECEAWGRAGWTHGFEGQWHRNSAPRQGVDTSQHGKEGDTSGHTS